MMTNANDNIPDRPFNPDDLESGNNLSVLAHHPKPEADGLLGIDKNSDGMLTSFQDT